MGISHFLLVMALSCVLRSGEDLFAFLHFQSNNNPDSRLHVRLSQLIAVSVLKFFQIEVTNIYWLVGCAVEHTARNFGRGIYAGQKSV